MKVLDGIEYLKIGEVAKLIHRSPQTLKNWYAWAEQADKLDELPKLHYLDKRGARFIRKDEVDKIENFAKTIAYGSMSEFNRRLWGKRGIK